MADTRVTLSGPLFNGVAPAVLRRFADDWEREYADDTETVVQNVLRGVLKHPTGNYQSHIATRASGDGQEVHDSNIIYGPWLEGTGSRNATTRFKGYSTFRKVAQRQQAKAPSDANQMFRSRYLGKID